MPTGLPSGPEEPNGGESHLTPMRITPASLIACGSGGSSCAALGAGMDVSVTRKPSDAIVTRRVLNLVIFVPLLVDWIASVNSLVGSYFPAPLVPECRSSAFSLQ